MPPEYRFATRDFDRYIEDLRDRLGTHSRNVAYTTTQAVFDVFRKRVTAADGLTFAGVLPPVLRAIYVSDWRPAASPQPFGDRDALTDEVLAFRQAHNFAPRSAIGDVAWAVRRHTDRQAFENMLAGLPAAAAEFWTASDSPEPSSAPQCGD